MLRELRRDLLLKISGGEKRIGNPEEIRAWMLKQYQENPIVGDMFKAILHIKEDLLLLPHELPSLEQSKLAINEFESSPLPKFCFVSSSMKNKPLGVLIQRDNLQVGGLVYAVTIFNQQDLIKMVSRMEIRACSKEPEPFVSALTENGWSRFSKEEIHHEPLFVFALQCLAAYHRYKYPTLPFNSIKDNRSIEPRSNDYFVRLLANAYKGKVKCTRASIPLEIIQPRDIDYALSVPAEEIKTFMPCVAEWGKPTVELLLYEKEGALVMDDDYLAYLSYRALEAKRVPAVIVGNFTQPLIEILTEGHGELIPPISVRMESKLPQVTISKQELLQRKLLSLTPQITASAQFEARFVTFCRLLSDKSTLEKDLHNFIKNNPSILDCHLASLFSEVRIGRYRADLVLQYEQTDRRIVLIELERHCDRIFTKSNRLREKVTHASQQVEDWIGEIRADTPAIPDWLKRNYTAEGAVVIGRSSDLTQKQKNILFTLNSNRLVKIITYDDLLERMRRLITILGQ